ncbi:MAG: hypothetical protein JWO22_74 [Frankiales bacterium]|nr:hypothetical protein [Frankiales bacterium]
MKLLEGLVDDAGLFPPTSLPMADALARHRSVHHPMLTGRFLVPGDRLAELSDALDGPIDVHVIGPGTTSDDRIRVLAREGREPGEMPCYVEGDDPGSCYGKVRCTGISDADLARFIEVAARESRPFKATAGLHRAVRGWDGEGFHGYLNVLVATAFAISGGKALGAIQESDPHVLVEEVRRLSDDQVTALRWLLHSYGSCDTTQPYLDAQELGLDV